MYNPYMERKTLRLNFVQGMITHNKTLRWPGHDVGGLGGSPRSYQLRLVKLLNPEGPVGLTLWNLVAKKYTMHGL